MEFNFPGIKISDVYILGKLNSEQKNDVNAIIIKHKCKHVFNNHRYLKTCITQENNIYAWVHT